MEKNSALVGNLACFTAYAIFGFNIISCKSIALDGNTTPMALFCLRSFGATALFWIWSLFTGLDSLNTLKILATVLVFVGVGLVNFVPKGKAARPRPISRA